MSVYDYILTTSSGKTDLDNFEIVLLAMGQAIDIVKADCYALK